MKPLKHSCSKLWMSHREKEREVWWTVSFSECGVPGFQILGGVEEHTQRGGRGMSILPVITSLYRRDTSGLPHLDKALECSSCSLRLCCHFHMQWTCSQLMLMKFSLLTPRLPVLYPSFSWHHPFALQIQPVPIRGDWHIWGHLTLSENSLSFHNWRERGCYWHLMGRWQDLSSLLHAQKLRHSAPELCVYTNTDLRGKRQPQSPCLVFQPRPQLSKETLQQSIFTGTDTATKYLHWYSWGALSPTGALPELRCCFPLGFFTWYDLGASFLPQS